MWARSSMKWRRTGVSGDATFIVGKPRIGFQLAGWHGHGCGLAIQVGVPGLVGHSHGAWNLSNSTPPLPLPPCACQFQSSTCSWLLKFTRRAAVPSGTGTARARAGSTAGVSAVLDKGGVLESSPKPSPSPPPHMPLSIKQWLPQSQQLKLMRLGLAVPWGSQSWAGWMCQAVANKGPSLVLKSSYDA